MGKKQSTPIDQARDEVFSHIQRCGVLGASPDDQREWLQETMEYLADRYPHLSDRQLDQVGIMAERYIAPAIPHGKDKNARNRDEWHSDPVMEELESDSVDADEGARPRDDSPAVTTTL